MLPTPEEKLEAEITQRLLYGQGRASNSRPAHGSAARLEKLLDAAFGVLAHDCDPLDQGSIKQRKSLKAKFAKILRVRQNVAPSHAEKNL